MKDWQSQSHVKWDCKYHVVILPKYRRKEFFGRIGEESGRFFGSCAGRRRSSWWRARRCRTTSTCC